MIVSDLTGQVADEIESLLAANFAGFTIYGKDDTLENHLKNIYRMPGIVINVVPAPSAEDFLGMPDVVTIVITLLFLYPVNTDPEEIKADVLKARRLMETYSASVSNVEQLNYASPSVDAPETFTAEDGTDLVYFVLTAQIDFVEG